MTTPLFPDALALQFATFQSGRLESTDVETAYSGREVRRARFPLGGYRYFEATTAPLTQADAQSLRDFLEARQGKFDQFYFYPPDSEYYSGEAAGTVTGSSTFTLPFRDIDIDLSTGIKVGGISKVVTVAPHSGTNGEDVITFVAGSQTGAVTITGLARPRILVRSDLDDYRKAFMLTADFRSVWTLRFKEVR